MRDQETAKSKRPQRAYRRSAHRAWAAGVCLASMLVLASCGEDRPDSSALGFDAPSDTSLITGSVQGLQRSGVFIQLPAGLPDELASQLLARFQEASIANQLTLARTGTVPEYTVKGVVRAGAARDGTAVVVVWEVINTDGKRVKRITDDLVIQRPNAATPASYDPWAVVDEAALEEIADEAALELAAWVSDQTLGASPDDTFLTTASVGDADIEAVEETKASATSPSVDLPTPSLVQSEEAASLASESSGIAARDATLSIAPSAAAIAAPEPAAETVAPAASMTVPERAAEETESPNALMDVVVQAPTGPVQDAPSPTAAGAASRTLFDVAVGTSPGDGRLSLAAAVQDALLKADHQSDQPQAFRVIGKVSLDPIDQGSVSETINVSIEWTVTTKDGIPLGLVTQSNKVDQGALAGAWGSIAEEAGTAAAQGILQLIDQPSPPA